MRDLLADAGIAAALDDHRGFDHGAWVPLSLAYPAADVPVIQLSVQSALGAAHHVALGRALAPLRDEGVLLLGSGGATHDLRRASLGGTSGPPVPADVRAFEEWLVSNVEAGATDGPRRAGRSARRTRGQTTRRPSTSCRCSCRWAPPTTGTKGRVLHRTFAYGALSMAAFAWD